MGVKRVVGGARSFHLEYEVPGTPEQVWQAIATGPGISSWLFPAEVEEREGGAVRFDLGPGMASAGTVIGWEPPRRFAYEEADWAPGAPPLGTEFVIEARDGGTCVVRLVHSLFATSDEWDDQFDSFERGWNTFFAVLRVVLTHYVGQESAMLRGMVAAPGSETETFDAMTGALGLAGAAPGERRTASPGAPPFGGVVEQLGWSRHPYQMLMRLVEPAPGVAVLGAYTWGGSTQALVSVYYFGERAKALVARDEPVWTAWMKEQFPSAVESGKVA